MFPGREQHAPRDKQQKQQQQQQQQKQQHASELIRPR